MKCVFCKKKKRESLDWYFLKLYFTFILYIFVSNSENEGIQQLMHFFFCSNAFM